MYTVKNKYILYNNVKILWYVTIANVTDTLHLTKIVFNFNRIVFTNYMYTGINVCIMYNIQASTE